MKKKSAPDPKAMNRILTHLAKVGWVKTFAEFDPTKARGRTLCVEFTPKGLAHISDFKRLHDDLGDISETDRHLFYDLLLLSIFENLERHGELGD